MTPVMATVTRAAAPGGLPVLPGVEMVTVLAAGGVAGLGVVLVLIGLTTTPATTVGRGAAARVAIGRGARRALVAAGVAVVVLVLSRWLVAAVVAAVAVLLWERLVGGAGEERRSIARLEGLAAWTESLRDTIAGAVGLDQAIPATAHAAPAAVAQPLRALADRLAVRVPMTAALRRFAADLDDSGADLVVAALVLNAGLRGPGLRDVLTSLAVSIREETEVRRRIAAGRQSTRRSVQIVLGVSAAFMIGLSVLNRAYVEPYSTPLGQLVLVVVFGLFGAGAVWLRRLASYQLPQRFLTGGSVPS